MFSLDRLLLVLAVLGAPIGTANAMVVNLGPAKVITTAGNSVYFTKFSRDYRNPVNIPYTAGGVNEACNFGVATSNAYDVKEGYRSLNAFNEAKCKIVVFKGGNNIDVYYANGRVVTDALLTVQKDRYFDDHGNNKTIPFENVRMVIFDPSSGSSEGGILDQVINKAINMATPQADAQTRKLQRDAVKLAIDPRVSQQQNNLSNVRQDVERIYNAPSGSNASAQVGVGTVQDLLASAIMAALDDKPNELERIVKAVGDSPKPQRGDRKKARRYNREGLQYLNDKAFAAAVGVLREAHRIDPADQEISNNLGYALVSNKQLRDAEEMLFSTLMIEPTRTSAWINLGLLYADQNQSPKAIGSLLNGYRYSRNREKTVEYLKGVAENTTQSEKSIIDSALSRMAVMK